MLVKSKVQILLTCILCICLLSGLAGISSAENLLVNPGFETGFPNSSSSSSNSVGAVYSGQSWNCQVLSAAAGWAYTRMESAPPVAPASIHSGSDALRFCGEASTDMLAYQKVGVMPGEHYVATVWVKTVDATGYGFGQGSNDYARLWIQEYDSAGNFVWDDGYQEVRTAGDYTQLTVDFTTQPGTSQVWFILDGSFGCQYQNGWIVWDDCSLEGNAVLATVTGKVTCAGTAVEGVTVAVGAKSAITGSDGIYTIQDVPAGPSAIIQASKSGYYTETRNTELVSGSNTMDFTIAKLPTNNLLLNPGFEQGPIIAVGANISGNYNLWTYAIGGSQSYMYPESLVGNWAAPVGFHNGNEAQSMHTEGNGHMSAYQDVSVKAGADYIASTFVQGTSPAGMGFGYNSTDSAGFIIEEYGVNGNLIKTHPKTDVKTSSPYWQYISYAFKTDANTSKVRYILDTVIGCIYSDGRVKYDDCALDGPSGVAAIKGKVVAGGTPMGGATVELLKVANNATTVLQSTTTASDGTYIFDNLSYRGQTITVRASSSAYYAQRKDRVLDGVITVDFDLTAVGNNILRNAGFDDGNWLNDWTFTNISDERVPSLNNWGPSYIHSGAYAVTVFAPGGNASGNIFQTVSVLPDTNYTAAVQFHAAWTASTVWGTNPDQLAYLFVQEYDASGNPVGQQQQTNATIFDLAQWEKITIPFKTSTQTALVKVGAYAYMVDDFYATLGRATFDSFELNGPKAGSATLGDAKLLPDGSGVTVTNQVVTAVLNGYFYVEDPTRSTGIKVVGTQLPAVAVGDRISLAGVISTDENGERVIAFGMFLSKTAGEPLGALGITNKNTKSVLVPGLLVRTWGKVTAVAADNSYAYVDDGSNVNDGTGNVGVRVVLNGLNIQPKTGDNVTVTGVVGMIKDGESSVLVVRVRDAINDYAVVQL